MDITKSNCNIVEFNWLDFIDRAEFVLDHFGKVSHIVYEGIQIHIVKFDNFIQVGAFKFDKESHSDTELIHFFETSGCGVLLLSIINAFENGRYFINYNMPTANSKNNPLTFLEHAFIKGKNSQKKEYYSPF